MTKHKLERITILKPAFDKRSPIPEKNYGIGNVKCLMVLKGKKGAVHFIFGTGMYLAETHRKWLVNFPDHDPVQYMGYDVGYHSPTPDFENQIKSQDKCEWIGKPCYCDGSAMRADKWMDILVRQGSEKIWEMLEKDYQEMFGRKSSLNKE